MTVTNLNEYKVLKAVAEAVAVADEAKVIAQDAVAELEANRDRLNAKAQSVLNKYQLL